MEFEILIDCSFSEINLNQSLAPIDKKFTTSFLNDFEDGQWRYSKFQSFIWDNIAETSLSFKERESLVNHSLLVAAAKNLRLTDSDKEDIGRGSELAEIVLYGLMKHHYQALPVVPKIFYKQNSQDNAKGADSVHIVVESNGDFSIWFGEAKFYNNIEDARLSSIVTSVENSLKTDKLKKENSIITNVQDLDELLIDKELKETIKNTLSNKSSIDDLKPRLHIPILIMHECEITAKSTQVDERYKSEVLSFHCYRATSYFNKQIKKLKGSVHLYSDITFHIILFPVPNKDKIVDMFVKNVEHYKDQ
ncbi:hypothetical protein Y017_12325 [Alcanivorax sp. 97CO-5]|uniref:HamA C-terminal domain-containing protein n=1 Tax=unclassified Alcanivorax TaxID=2638842 RepID=UPI0003E7EFA6|nr:MULTISPECIES: DUF1837 domain-containing protein [unclassified Alcanivorax]EUC69699.1 hypothetical protein Y017_12325 [Alcanivorax sp. 97CO-5]PKG01539.1 DUF1837 domain-containing protein [Alcanivorax sp. 97CO-6]